MIIFMIYYGKENIFERYPLTQELPTCRVLLCLTFMTRYVYLGCYDDVKKVFFQNLQTL